MDIREMAEADLQAVYEIECECFSVPWHFESLRKELTNQLATYIVAIEGEEIIGYAGMWGILGEGEITNIAVRESHRGEGVGKLLMTEILEMAKAQALHVMTLEVRATNEVAQAVYTKKGFKQIALRKNYYQKPTEDAVIMQLVF